MKLCEFCCAYSLKNFAFQPNCSPEPVFLFEGHLLIIKVPDGFNCLSYYFSITVKELDIYEYLPFLLPNLVIKFKGLSPADRIFSKSSEMREDLEKGDLLRGGEAENQIIYSLLPAVD